MSAGAATFYITGGTLRHDAPSYIERQADRDLLNGLRNGEFCYVLTSRQMGKSSLMVRTANKLRDGGVNIIVLDLTAIGQNLTPEQWYDGLLMRLGRQLDLEDKLEENWEKTSRLGPCQRFFGALRDAVLPSRPGPLVVFVDEIDTVRSLPFSTDEFFSAIRECYNRRGEDPEFRRLTFCLLGVATPSDLIRDTRTTPFNVGRRVELHDFSEIEAVPLAQGLGHLLSSEAAQTSANGGPEGSPGIRRARRILNRIMHWTGGHPYLTQRFCRAVAEDSKTLDAAGVDRLGEGLYFSSRAMERDDNLLFVRERLLRSETDLPSLLELYLKVRSGRNITDEETNQLISVLRLSGIVKAAHGNLVVRNRIYSRVFNPQWVEAQMPDADRRRQRAAFYRGVVRTSAIAAVVVVTLISAVLFALNQAEQARKALAESSFSQARSERISGRAGQRVMSLAALEKALPYYSNKMELRNEAIAAFALVDLKPDPVSTVPPSAAAAVALNRGVTHYASGDTQGVIKFLEIQGKRVAAQLPPTEPPISWLAVSPNGRFVAAQYDGEEEHRLIVWDVVSERSVLALTNSVLQSALDFSGDDSKVAVGLPDGRVDIFAVPEGILQVSMRSETQGGQPRAPLCLRFDPSGNRLAESSRASQFVHIRNLVTLETNKLYHPSFIRAMAWSPDGNHLATASENHDLYLWDLHIPDKPPPPFRAHSDAIIDLAFNSSGELLASVGMDKVVKLWTTATRRAVTYPVESDGSGRLYFSQDGQRLGYAGVKSGVQVWNILGPDHYRVFRALGGVNADFSSLCFSSEGRVVVAANDLGIFFWDAAVGRELPFHPLKATTSALVHPVRGDLLASTWSGFYRWRQQTMQDGNALTLKFGPSECLDLPARLGRCAWGPGAGEAVVIHEGHIHLVDTEVPSASSTLPFKGPFEILTTSPDGKWLVTWAPDQKRQIEVWDLPRRGADAKAVQVIAGLQHFAFSPDGGLFVSCSSRQYHLRDTETWQIQKPTLALSQSGDSHCVVAFARAGKKGETLLALANSPTTIKLFRVVAGSPPSLLELATLESPDPQPLLALAFNNDGSRLAAATKDQIVQVWNLAKIRDELARIKLEGDLPTFAASPEGPLTVVFEPDTLDTETPQRWQEVETMTLALTRAADLEARVVASNLVRRGKCYLALLRPLDARQDFQEALRYSRDDSVIREWLQKAEAALQEKATSNPGDRRRKATVDEPMGRSVPRKSEENDSKILYPRFAHQP